MPTTVYSTHEDVKTEYYTDYKTTTIKASLSRVHHFRGYANQNTKQVPEVIHTQTRVCYDKDIDVTTYKEEESKYPVTNSKVHTETETKVRTHVSSVCALKSQASSSRRHNFVFSPLLTSFSQEYPTQYHSTYTTEAPHPEKTSKVEHVTKYHTYVKTEKQCKQEQKCWTKKQRKDW